MRAEVCAKAHIWPFFLFEVYLYLYRCVCLSHLKLDLGRRKVNLDYASLLEGELALVDVVSTLTVRPSIAIIGQEITAMAQSLI